MGVNKEVEYMRFAVREARRSRHEDNRPHPNVGVVVVRDSKVLATACRGDQDLGDHAEFGALEKKLGSETLAGCTVYTTLEPCTTRNHPKVPCAVRLVERHVARVVIGALDPDQRITGQGVLRLRRAGIAVDLFTPDLMAEVEELNRDFTRACEARSATQPLPADRTARDLATWLLSYQIEDPLIRGIGLREAGQPKRAIDCLEAAAKVEPGYPRYYSNAAHAYANIGDLDRAIEYLGRALDIRRTTEGMEWPRYHYHLARYCVARGHSGDAASATNHLSHAIAAGPNWKDEAIRDRAIFGSILDDAFSRAAELGEARVRARADTLEQIKCDVSAIPNVVHASVYGSYWLNGATNFRDIDVCVVTAGPETKGAFVSKAADVYSGTPINMYIVPLGTLLSDVECASHGQFYSFKYILGAEAVVNEPEVDACVLLIVKQAIREAVVWCFKLSGQDLFSFRYRTDWFIGLVLNHRLARDKTFCRSLKRLFDHYSDRPLCRLRRIYENALGDLRRGGLLSEGPGRDGLWALDHKKILEWEKVEGRPTDGQIVDRFWQTYEEFKQPNGKTAVTVKRALLHAMPPRSVREIENQVDRLVAEGRISRRENAH